MKFSVITVCKNSARTISKTFDMMLVQQFKDYEYIVVDGASTDGTLDIIKSYADKFEGRMRYVSEPDTGIFNAMNKGIRMAQGEWIGIIGSDDWYEPDALQVVNDSILKKSLGELTILHGICSFFEMNGCFKEARGASSTLLTKGMIPHPASFVNKMVYEKIGYYDELYKIAGDYDLFLKFYYSGVNFVFVDRIIANFSEGGVSSSKSTKLLAKLESIRLKRKYGFISNVEYYLRYLWYETLKKF